MRSELRRLKEYPRRPEKKPYEIERACRQNLSTIPGSLIKSGQQGAIIDKESSLGTYC